MCDLQATHLAIQTAVKVIVLLNLLLVTKFEEAIT